jgi:hypothetical protein
MSSRTEPRVERTLGNAVEVIKSVDQNLTKDQFSNPNWLSIWAPRLCAPGGAPRRGPSSQHNPPREQEPHRLLVSGNYVRTRVPSLITGQPGPGSRPQYSDHSPLVTTSGSMQLLVLSLVIMCASLSVVSSLPCKTAEDCSLAGTCNAAGQCDCFPGFLPPDCGALALGGSQRAWLPDKNRTTWGGSPIKGSDGTYHLFAAMNRYGTVDTWPNSSVIVHATSARPGGPYGNHSIILGNRSADFFDGNAVQNPVAVQLQDRSVALFYVGLTCQISESGYSSNDCLDSANSSLGVAHAPSPYGPWTRSDTSMLAADPTTFEGDSLANPAAIQVMRLHAHWRTPSHTHWLIHRLTHWHTASLTHCLTHWLTASLAHLLTGSLTAVGRWQHPLCLSREARRSGIDSISAKMERSVHPG